MMESSFDRIGRKVGYVWDGAWVGVGVEEAGDGVDGAVEKAGGGEAGAVGEGAAGEVGAEVL